MLLSIVSISLRIAFTKNLLKQPKRTTIRIISVVGLICLIIEGVIDRQIGIAAMNLLVMGCALKFLEYINERDSYVQIISLIFMSILPLIFHYESYIAIYLICICVMIVWAFLAVTHRDNNHNDIALLSKVILPAIPLTITLFLVFPRFGAFWYMPGNEKQAISGITKEFSVSNIESISRSDKLVAHVEFQGEIPKTRYFRAITYSRQIADKWLISPELESYQWRLVRWKYGHNQKDKPFGSNGVSYDMLMEPTNTLFMPTLMYSSTSDHGIYYQKDDTYILSSPISSRVLHHFTYHPDYEPKKTVLQNKNELLSFDKYRNKQTQKLVQELTSDKGSEIDKANAIFVYFNHDLTYSLTPGVMAIDEIDDLLFVKKKGFCAHFANAMANMLRMAGIPSRIVSGYLAGTIPEGQKYVVLREYDAHAWVEAFIDGQWISYDPTNLVSPGLATAGNISALNTYPEFSLQNDSFMAAMRNFYEKLEYSWSRFILNFDKDSQQGLFKNSIVTILIIFALGVVVYLVSIAIGIFSKKKEKLAPELIAFRKLINFLKKKSIISDAYETPEKALEKISDENIRQSFKEIVDIFTVIHYTKTTSDKKQLLTQLQFKIKNLTKLVH